MSEYKASILLTLKDEVSKAMAGVGDSISSSFQRALPASQMLLGGVTALGASVVAFTGYGVKSAMSMEDLRTQFDVMLGSAEKGKKLFSDLSIMANITPFDTEDLAAATKTLLGFGVANEQVLPDLKMMGDVALGNKEKLQGLTLAFAQIQATGKLTGQDLLQMINNGFNPLEYISKRTGKSIGELKENMDKVPISAKQVQQAFIDATSEGGRFYQGMDKGSQTFSGLMSTVQDNIGKVARSLVGLNSEGDIVKGSLFDGLKTKADELGKALTKFSSDISSKGIAGVLREIFPPETHKTIAIITGALLGGLTPALWAMASAVIANVIALAPFLIAGAAVGALGYLIYTNWEKIKPTFDALRPVLGALVVGISAAIIAFIAITTATTIATGAMSAFGAVLAFVTSPIGIIVIAIGVLAAAAYLVYKNWGPIKEWFSGLWKSITSSFESGKTKAISFINNLTDSAKEKFSSFVNSIKSIFSRVVDFITDPFKSAWKLVSSIADKIKGALNKINPFHRESPSLVDNVQLGIEAIKQKYLELGDIGISPVTRGIKAMGTQSISNDTSYSFAGATFQINVPSGKANDFLDELQRLTSQSNLLRRI